MIKIIVTGAIVSKGYNEAPALNFSDNGEVAVAWFRIGKSVYDKNADNNKRWINMSVKAFGGICERIKKMQLNAGSYVNIAGRYDEETWQDKTTGEQKSAPVLIVDEIEYCYSEKKDTNDTGDKSTPATQYPAQNGAANNPPEESGGFTGYEGFGGNNSFFQP